MVCPLLTQSDVVSKWNESVGKTEGKVSPLDPSITKRVDNTSRAFTDNTHCERSALSTFIYHLPSEGKILASAESIRSQWLQSMLSLAHQDHPIYELSKHRYRASHTERVRREPVPGGAGIPRSHGPRPIFRIVEASTNKGDAFPMFIHQITLLPLCTKIMPVRAAWLRLKPGSSIWRGLNLAWLRSILQNSQTDAPYKFIQIQSLKSHQVFFFCHFVLQISHSTGTRLHCGGGTGARRRGVSPATRGGPFQCQ